MQPVILRKTASSRRLISTSLDRIYKLLRIDFGSFMIKTFKPCAVTQPPIDFWSISFFVFEKIENAHSNK